MWSSEVLGKCTVLKQCGDTGHSHVVSVSQSKKLTLSQFFVCLSVFVAVTVRDAVENDYELLLHSMRDTGHSNLTYLSHSAKESYLSYFLCLCRRCRVVLRGAVEVCTVL